MKKLLIGLLALGSISAFSSECKIHVSHVSMEGFSNASLASKVARKIKKNNGIVVKDQKNANVGIRLRYTFIPLADSITDNGPYPETTNSNYKIGVNALMYKEGHLKKVFKYETTEVNDIAISLLEDLGC